MALWTALKLTDATGHHNLKARLERANILILTKEYGDAIEEFRSLLQIIPNEWKIHFHLGEVFLKIGERDRALQSFNRAMALNPKDKNTIKHAIQNIYSPTNSLPDYPQSARPSAPRAERHPPPRRVRGAHSGRSAARAESYFGRGIAEEAEQDDGKETDEEMDARMSGPMDEDHRGGSYDESDFVSFDEMAAAQRRNGESVDAVGPTHSNSLSPTL